MRRVPTDDYLASLRGVSAGYGGGDVIRDLDFRVEPGMRVAVLGQNGGGKSTLFRALLGELEVTRGVMDVRARCGTVPQTERSRLDYPVSALDVALMGTLGRLSWWRRPGRAERGLARESLEVVGLGELAGRQFGELSGGQRQRVMIARALVQDARLLLLDEPFNGLDRPGAELLVSLIERLSREGRGVMIATHDLDQARGWDSVLCLNGRQIACGDPGDVLTREVIEATYGSQVTLVPEPNAGPDEDTPAVLPPHDREV